MGDLGRLEPVEIREAGLVVRPWSAPDADAVFRACQDPDIQRWTTVPRPYQREHAESYVGPLTAQGWADGTSATFGVYDAETSEVVGACGLTTIEPALSMAEIGFWTAPWARGRSVATTAARAVSRWAMDTLKVRRLLWRAEVGNFASRLVAARVGYRYEGLQRQSIRLGRGGLGDAWVGALLPGELREAGDQGHDLAGTARRAAVFGRPQPTLPIQTDRGESIRLRPLRADDMPRIIEACRDPLSLRYTTVPDPYREADADSFVHDFAPNAWRQGSEVVFAVADGDDAYAGSISLRLHGDGLTTDRADVGYLIGPWARGRGFAPAAVRALADWGFDDLGLRRIEWQAFLGNDASRLVAQRAGFILEGTARASLWHRTSYQDTWTGARLATDERQPEKGV